MVLMNSTANKESLIIIINLINILTPEEMNGWLCHDQLNFLIITAWS
jgi:hypothetical protein